VEARRAHLEPLVVLMAVLGSMVAMKLMGESAEAAVMAGTAVAAVTLTPGANIVTVRPKLAASERWSPRSVSACGSGGEGACE
jgi:hypothetical protein